MEYLTCPIWCNSDYLDEVIIHLGRWKEHLLYILPREIDIEEERAFTQFTPEPVLLTWDIKSPLIPQMDKFEGELQWWAICAPVSSPCVMVIIWSWGEAGWNNQRHLSTVIREEDKRSVGISASHGLAPKGYLFLTLSLVSWHTWALKPSATTT